MDRRALLQILALALLARWPLQAPLIETPLWRFVDGDIWWRA